VLLFTVSKTKFADDCFVSGPNTSGVDYNVPAEDSYEISHYNKKKEENSSMATCSRKGDLNGRIENDMVRI